jgi:hypothetical protein
MVLFGVNTSLTPLNLLVKDRIVEIFQSADPLSNVVAPEAKDIWKAALIVYELSRASAVFVFG